jgi:ubiquinone/menaquinone biosynthesis C-methylase UbiE
MNSDQSSGRSSAGDYYDRVAETWDQTHGVACQNPRFARQVRDHLKSLLSRVDRNATALELGAGTGPYVDVTAPLFGRLIATDLSDGMLAVFARRISQLGLTNVALMRQDACNLSEIANESVDVVYSLGLLETIADFDRLFAESYRVLRPGGFVAGITSNGDCPWYSLRKWLEGGERHGRTGYLATAESLDAKLRHTGFTAPEITYWGAIPPGMQNRLLIASLGAVESVVAATRLARYLGVLCFRSHRFGGNTERAIAGNIDLPERSS